MSSMDPAQQTGAHVTHLIGALGGVGRLLVHAGSLAAKASRGRRARDAAATATNATPDAAPDAAAALRALREHRDASVCVRRDPSTAKGPDPEQDGARSGLVELRRARAAVARAHCEPSRAAGAAAARVPQAGGGLRGLLAPGAALGRLDEEAGVAWAAGIHAAALGAGWVDEEEGESNVWRARLFFRGWRLQRP
jgi:hypothetical protein